MKRLASYIGESILDTTADFDIFKDVLGGKEHISSSDIAKIVGDNIKELVLPEGIKSIYRISGRDTEAFVLCPAIERIVFPSTLQEIDGGTFSFMKNLKEVVFDPKCKNVFINPQAFQYCSKLRSVNIPRGAAIGDGVFEYCTDLTDVSFDKEVDLQGDGIFYDCTSLRKVDMSKVEIRRHALPNRTFAECTSLKELFLHRSTDTIGRYAFEGCENLTHLKAPGVNTVKLGAFRGCNKLKTRP